MPDLDNHFTRHEAQIAYLHGNEALERPLEARPRRASTRIRSSRLTPSSSMSSQTRATSSTSTLCRVRGRIGFIPTKAS